MWDEDSDPEIPNGPGSVNFPKKSFVNTTNINSIMDEQRFVQLLESLLSRKLFQFAEQHV